jgi:cation transport ATPase
MSSDDRPSRFRDAWDHHGEAITTALCACFVVAGWLAARQGAGLWVTTPLFLVAYVIGGYRQAIEGTTKLFRERELEVDLLMVVAAIGAAAIGAWVDGALLILIFALSGTLEGYASARTQRDLEALMALHPEEALVARDGREQLIAASTLVVGDLVVVKPGERIPADGQIVEGASAVDQASITGESLPVDKRVGDEVFAGTINGSAIDVVFAMAAAIEGLSSHPLGRAIVAEAKRRGIAVPEATNHEAVGGLGAHATVEGVRRAIGKPGMFASVPDEVLAQRRRLEAEGKTVVLVGDHEVRGLLALRDTVRPEARAAIAELRRLGVQRVVMLTGDGAVAARAIADEAGIDEVHADLLPQDKTRIVEDLVRRFGRVAMVGDGVNDAPALAAATVGIAMGAAGTDVALETADVVLTTDDLGKIPYAVALGRRALGVVKQNLVVALGVIVTLVLADLLGRINLPTGVVGHEGSTLLVTLNGLRLLARIPAIQVEVPGAARATLASAAPIRPQAS